jgi:hypothetical protein
MPAAVVQQGTTLDQRVVAATLADLHARVAEAGLKSPCLIIVGEVVRLRDQLAWFDRRTLPATIAEVDGVPLDMAPRPAQGRAQSA